MDLKISAFIPHFNQFDYLEDCVLSVLEHDLIFNKILVIDDGSKNQSELQFLNKFERVHLIKNKKNMGRGYCRNLAIKEISDPFVLMLDATNYLPKGFVKLGLSHFNSDKVSAVSGLINNYRNRGGFSANWRARHLFKEDFDFGSAVHEAKSLTTYGTILRKSSVIAVGNFNEKFRHSEDLDLGFRLKHGGYKIIGDPNLIVYSLKNDSIFSVLERYWRWYGGIEKKFSILDYLHAIKSSLRPMMQNDIQARDYKSALISFICPHYGFLSYLLRRKSRKSYDSGVSSYLRNKYEIRKSN